MRLEAVVFPQIKLIWLGGILMMGGYCWWDIGLHREASKPYFYKYEKRIALVGSGRMAHNLSEGFVQNGHVISHLIARPSEKATALSQHLNAQWVSFDNLQLESLAQIDLIVLAVSDDVIEATASCFAQDVQQRIPIVHTAASISMKALGCFNASEYFIHFKL